LISLPGIDGVGAHDRSRRRDVRAIRTSDAMAHYKRGVALTVQENLEEAIAEIRERKQVHSSRHAVVAKLCAPLEEKIEHVIHRERARLLK